MVVGIAAADELVVESASPVELAGDFSGRILSGSFHHVLEAGSGVGEFHGATGRVSLWSWQIVSAPGAAPQVRDAEEQQFFIENGTLAVAYSSEPFGLRVAPRGGAVSVHGTVDAQGVPRWLDAALDRDAGASQASLVKQADKVPVEWEAGWPYVGAFGPPVPGFPDFAHAMLDVQGDAKIQITGGVVSFVDDQSRAQKLIIRTTQDSPGTLLGTQTWRRLIFEGSVAGSDVAIGGEWAMAGPDLTWAFNGTISWSDAAGTANDNGSRMAFTDANVVAEVAMDLRAQRVTAIESPSYLASGDLRSLTIDGARVPTRSEPLPVDATQAAGVASLLLVTIAFLTQTGQEFAGRFAAVLYTRLAPARLLDHPKRQRIHNEVRTSPGLHLRELHRRVGGAWGPFTFHLRLLAKAGYLKVVTTTGYSVAVPPDTPTNDATLHLPPNPLVRSIYRAIPADGSVRAILDIATELAISRDLAGYHIRTLETKGLVHRVELSDRRMGVALGAAKHLQAGAQNNAP